MALGIESQVLQTSSPQEDESPAQTPVSYTHLDVYKRQGLDTFRGWKGIDFQNNCMRQELLGEDPGLEKSDLGEQCEVLSVGIGSTVERSLDHGGKNFAQPLHLAIEADWNKKKFISKKEQDKNIQELKHIYLFYRRFIGLHFTIKHVSF